ncbi:translation initiation factor [Aeromonas salmonicida]|uniref:translation initiation factor n=1 Tax=Aeromonas salmonicida TaxID=645 RepID=UPI001C5EC29E|nr:stress response translation initiation inhibitor YciH [Aeromonas salmonicida]
MSHDNNSHLVYSTDGGMIKEQTQPQSDSPFPQDGTVRIRRETKGRKGAGVITIHGVPAEQQKTIATLLKKKCGTGGGLKEGIIEIQGDKRDLIKTELEKAGFSVKLVGG